MFNTLQKHKTMKRLLTIGLMLVSAFALTNCAEEITAPVQDDITVDGNIENNTPSQEDVDIPFEVYANVGNEVETKTENRGNNTYWVADDGISVFHKTGNVITHNKEFTISADNLQYGLFEGGLNSQLGETNDWYFIYPYNSKYTYSSSGPSLTIKDVQIGAQTINQDLINTINKDITLSANSKAYICDKLSPMYGVKKQQSRDKTPDITITMNHLAAIAAIKIVNDGHGGDVVISNIEFKAPEAIVGTFKVSLNDNDNVSFEASTAATTARVELPSPTRIEYGKSITIYVPIKPFDASGKEITIAVNGTAVKNNGVSRSVTIPAGTKFQAGKVTTLKVPVNILSYHDENVDPATSNVMELKVQVFDKISGSIFTGGYKMNLKEGFAVTTSNSSTADVIINGKETKAYVIGTESKVGTISIHGIAKELINYMPMEFYAAAWNNNKAVMRVENVTVHTNLAIAALLGHKLSLDYSLLTSMMDGGKITFSGLVPLEQVTYDGNSKPHMVFLDEEPYHKPISISKFESLLASFDNDTKDDFKPTFEGLKAAITNPANLRSSYDLTTENLTEAEITAYCVWKKIDSKVSGNSLMSFAASLTGDVLKSPKSLFEFASNSPIDVVLTTVAKGGEEGATDNRLIFWGLNSPEAN